MDYSRKGFLYMAARHKGSPILPWGRAKVVEIFSADLRSLAMFRIVLALLVLADLTVRATDLSAHYSDEGVLPRQAAMTHVLSRWQFSLGLINGMPHFQALLFGVAILAALAMLVGYRTRLVTVVVWVVLWSIQSRNFLVGATDEVLLRTLLFWGMFLPLGAYWSIDRALKIASPRLSMRFLSMATVGLFMNIAFVYWFSAYEKSGPEWRVDFTALYYALSLDQFATPMGVYLLQFSTLLKVLTFGTIMLEAFGPFLLFFPLLTGPVRTGAVLMFMNLHFGIWLTLDVGIFPWISAFGMVCFLPGWFWDVVVSKVRGAFPVEPAIARPLRRATRSVHAYWLPLRALLSPAGGVRWSYSIAGSAGSGGNRLEGPAKDEVAPASSEQGGARMATGGRRKRRDAGEPQPTVILRSSLATNLLAAFLLLHVFSYQITQVSPPITSERVSAFVMPESVEPVGTVLGLRQAWGVFSPAPPTLDGWHVIPGTLRSGQKVDLMALTRGDYYPREGVLWEKPRDVKDLYKNQHWRSYMDVIVHQENYAPLRRHLNRYICREWNSRHTSDERLTGFDMTYMLEETKPDYQRPTPQKKVLWKHSCS